MQDSGKYLLRTRSQADSFREKHRDALRQYAGAYRRWIRSLPFMVWTPLRLREDEMEVVIGIICMLYIDGYVCISFSDDMRFIRNEPLDDAEMKQWMKATGWHGPGIDRKEKEKLG